MGERVFFFQLSDLIFRWYRILFVNISAFILVILTRKGGTLYVKL